jgi:hypothetical protein
MRTISEMAQAQEKGHTPAVCLHRCCYAHHAGLFLSHLRKVCQQPPRILTGSSALADAGRRRC